MSSWQRRIVTALGGLIAVALVAVAIVAVRNDASDGIDDGGDEGARLEVAGEVEEAEDGEEATGSTFPLVPVTGGAPLPTTTAPPPPRPPKPSIVPAETAPPGTAAAAPPPAQRIRAVETVGAEGRVLKPPAQQQPARAVDKARGCNSANDAGWRIVECGALKRDDVVLLWVVETKGGVLRTIVLREQTAGQWALALEAEGRDWAKVGVRGEDVSGDGRPDLVFGFRSKSGDKGMDVDVVEAATVTMHTRLGGPSVSVVVKPAELHVWGSGAGGATDHVVLRWVDGAWEVALREQVPRSSVPASMV